MIIKLVVIVVVAALLYLSVDIQQMSDEKRKEFGLGPKGQGK